MSKTLAGESFLLRRRIAAVAGVIVLVCIIIAAGFGIYRYNNEIRLDIVFSESDFDKESTLEELKLLYSESMQLDHYVKKIWTDSDSTTVSIIFLKQNGNWVSDSIINKLINIRKVGAKQNSIQTITLKPRKGSVAAKENGIQVDYALGDTSYRCERVPSYPMHPEQLKCFFLVPGIAEQPTVNGRFSQEEYQLYMDDKSLLNQYYKYIDFDKQNNIVIHLENLVSDRVNLASDQYGFGSLHDIKNPSRILDPEKEDIYDLVFFKKIGHSIKEIKKRGQGKSRHIIFNEDGTTFDDLKIQTTEPSRQENPLKIKIIDQHRNKVTESEVADFSSYGGLFGREVAISDSLSINPDNTHIAYIKALIKPMSILGEPSFFMSLVVDNETQIDFMASYVSKLFFDPNGKQTAFSFRSGSDWHMVVNAVKSIPYAGLSKPSFSPDGTKVAYAVKKGQQWVLVVNDRESLQTYDEVSVPAFSPDSRRIGFSARDGNQWFMVVDDRASDLRFDDISILNFSPNNQRFAYLAKKKDKWMIVLDGKLLKNPYDDISEPYFSPDSQHLAFFERTGDNYNLIIDGEIAGPASNELTVLAFSPDSRQYGYGAYIGDKWLVVLNGEVQKSYDGISVGSLVFSPDNRDFAYVAQKGDKWMVVVNGQEGPEFDDIGVGPPSFSPDGRHLSYCAKRNDQWLLVIDDKEEVITGSPVASMKYVIFDESDMLHYLKIQNNRYILVERILE